MIYSTMNKNVLMKHLSVITRVCGWKLCKRRWILCMRTIHMTW